MDHEDFSSRAESPTVNSSERPRQTDAQRDLERERQRQAAEREFQRQEMRDRELQREIERERQRERNRDSSAEGRQATGVGLVIGNQLANPDPVSILCLYLIQFFTIILNITIFSAEFSRRNGAQERENNALVPSAKTTTGGVKGTQRG